MRRPELLVLDNALDHAFYRPVEHWARAAGFSPAAVWVAGGEPLPAPDRYRHVIVSGSEASITQRAGWAEEEARFLAEAIRAGAAVLGSCWGHQLLAVALAGPASVRRSASPEFGWQPIEVLEAGGLLPLTGLWSFVSHFDEIVPGCARELRVLARSPGCAIQAMRWADLPVWGVQAHPEIDPPAGRAFLEGAAQRWPEQADLFRRGLQGRVRDSGSVSGLVRRFLASGPRAG